MAAHTLTCTFCRKSEHQVRKLVAGPGVYICDECVAIAHRIMSDDGPTPPSEPRAIGRLARLRARIAGVRDRGWRPARRVRSAVAET